MAKDQIHYDIPASKLSRELAEQEIEFLYSEISKHNDLYHRYDAPEISDGEFDELFRRTIELENANPDLKAKNSPTERVGAEPLDGFKKVRHQLPMPGLDKAMENQDVDDFLKRVRRFLNFKDSEVLSLVAEPKWMAFQQVFAMKMVALFKGQLVAIVKLAKM